MAKKNHCEIKIINCYGEEAGEIRVYSSRNIDAPVQLVSDAYDGRGLHRQDLSRAEALILGKALIEAAEAKGGE